MKMENREPFKLIFKIFHFHGLWEADKLSRRHKNLLTVSSVSFMIFTALTSLFILQVGNTTDLARLLIVAPVFTLVIITTVLFYLQRHKIKDLVDEMNSKIDLNAAAFTDRAFKIAKILTYVKMIVAALTTLGSIIVPLFIEEMIIKTWLPRSWHGRKDVFYGVWFYETINILLYAPLYIAFQEFFLNLLIIINAYQQYFQWSLRQMQLNSVNGIEMLKNCVAMHQNLRKKVEILNKLTLFK